MSELIEKLTDEIEKQVEEATLYGLFQLNTEMTQAELEDTLDKYLDSLVEHGPIPLGITPDLFIMRCLVHSDGTVEFIDERTEKGLEDNE